MRLSRCVRRLPLFVDQSVVFSGFLDEGFDLGDVFRMLHGCGTDADADAYSWVQHKKGKLTRLRFDHVFAWRKLNAKSCQYLHTFRKAKLSDHSPIEVKFKPRCPTLVCTDSKNTVSP
jgi:exonuclease III